MTVYKATVSVCGRIQFEGTVRGRELEVGQAEGGGGGEGGGAPLCVPKRVRQ